MLILATPGLDLLDTEVDPARSTPWSAFWIGVNARVRMPIVRWFEPLQRPLRIAQSWSLYPRGPAKVRRFEVLVDGQVVYRSNDDDADWLASVLRYRRVRPIVGATCNNRSKNDDELVDYVVREARADFPQATEIVVRCTVSPWPGTSPKPSRSFVASAPDFRPRAE
jgi:hypothetical protein